MDHRITVAAALTSVDHEERLIVLCETCRVGLEPEGIVEMALDEIAQLADEHIRDAERARIFGTHRPPRGLDISS